jgi:hypothetical protein
MFNLAQVITPGVCECSTVAHRLTPQSNIGAMLGDADDDIFLSTCIVCEREIPDGHLQQRPFAAFCQECGSRTGLQFTQAA